MIQINPMYLIRTPQVVQNLFPNLIWRVDQRRTIYLTFDDGPVPEITPWVLDQLAQYDAKATFFCVGENVDRHPELLDQLHEQGHAVGSHTYHHLNGWKTDNVPYFHDVRRAAQLVDSDLFRPPYGRLKPRQVQFLQRHYRIVMWDVLSGDFDPLISPEDCFDNVIEHTRAGSIVVFHDSVKAAEKLRYALPKVLDYFTVRGYTFASLPSRQYQRRAGRSSRRA